MERSAVGHRPASGLWASGQVASQMAGPMALGSLGRSAYTGRIGGAA